MMEKEGDEEPVKAWKEHNEECQDIRSKVEALSSDCHIMHRKVDQIASCLGITLYHPGMERKRLLLLGDNLIVVGFTFGADSISKEVVGFSPLMVSLSKNTMFIVYCV